MAAHVAWIALIGVITLAGLSEGQVLNLTPGDPPAKALNTSVVFTCKAMGMENEETDTRIRWLRNEIEINELGGRVYIEVVSVQERKLYITRIQNTDAGEYTCMGFLEGNSQERKVSLQIFKDITFEHSPSPQDGTINEDFLIECRVTGQPAPTISWKRGTTTIHSGGRYTLTNEGLHIERLVNEDAGFYTCRAEVNEDGRFKQEDIKLDVNTPPDMNVPLPVKAIGTETQETSLVCHATGIPKPTYEFYKGDSQSPLPPNYDDRIFVNRDEGELAFRPVLKADEGKYRCVAFNKAGTVNSMGELFVAVVPRVFELKNETAREQASATLTCTFVADPPAAMTFQKVGNPQPYVLGSNEDGRIIVNSAEENVLKITIDPLKPEDTANYTCMGINDYGSGGKNGTIMVEFSPRFAADHMNQMYSWAGKKRNISCQAQGYPHPIMYWSHHGEQLDDRNNNETFRLYTFTHGRSNLQVTIRPEDQDWIYGKYLCHARNDIDPPATQTIELEKATIPDPPADAYVIASMSTPTMVHFNITPPEDDGGQPILRYEIAWDVHRQPFYPGDELKIINLRGETNYIFYITAINEVGDGEPFELAHTTANIRVPYPIEINSDPYGSYPHEYIIRWDEPRDGGFQIRYYEFNWRRVSVIDESLLFNTPLEDWNHQKYDDDDDNSMRWYKLQGLMSGEHYQVEVFAYNDRGRSDPHPEFVFVTLATERPPQPVGGGDGGVSAVTITPLVTAVSVILWLCHLLA